MSLGRALFGFIGVGTVLVGFGLAAVLVRRRYFPSSPAPMRQLIAVTVALAGVLGTGVLLGSIGLFRPAVLVSISVILGGVSGSLLRIRRDAQTSHAPAAVPSSAAKHPRWLLAAVGIAVALVAVRWVTELLETLGRGFSHTDELHYHLTHAAMFAQSGRTWPIRFASIGDGAAYHPAHSELLHAVGLGVLGSDFLSIFVNLGFAAMAMAAGWTIGRQAGNAPAGALLVGSVLSLWPSTAEAGAALNDTMAIALLLSATAFLLEAAARDGDRRYTALAGIAAGLAAGTKLTVLVPVVALTLLIVTWPDRTRVRALITYVGASFLAGGYWYVRNLLSTGNPVPALSFGPLPGPELEFQRSVEFPITDYVADLSIWREYFLPGFDRVFGVLWPLLPGLAVIAGLAALSRPAWRAGRAWTMLAVCGFVGLLAYIVTPTSAGGSAGAPVLFALNLRYAFPGLLLCAFAGLAHPIVRRRPQQAGAVAVLLFAASNLRGDDVSRTIVAATAVTLIAALVWVAVRLPGRRQVIVAATVAIAVVAAPLVQDRYLDRRWTVDLRRWNAYAAMQHVVDARIGVTGYPQTYPFYGRDLSNHVEVLADDSPGDELVPFEECDDLWRTVSESELDFVVVLSEPGFEDTQFGRSIIGAPRRWLHAADVPIVLGDRSFEILDVRGARSPCS